MIFFLVLKMANISTCCIFQHFPIFRVALKTSGSSHWSYDSLSKMALPTIKGSCVHSYQSRPLHGSISQLKLAGPTCLMHRLLFLIKEVIEKLREL